MLHEQHPNFQNFFKTLYPVTMTPSTVRSPTFTVPGHMRWNTRGRSMLRTSSSVPVMQHMRTTQLRGKARRDISFNYSADPSTGDPPSRKPLQRPLLKQSYSLFLTPAKKRSGGNGCSNLSSSIPDTTSRYHATTSRQLAFYPKRPLNTLRNYDTWTSIGTGLGRKCRTDEFESTGSALRICAPTDLPRPSQGNDTKRLFGSLGSSISGGNWWTQPHHS